jgi:large subunit ribosomal protein L4
MTLDVVNSQNEKVGAVDLSDAVFGGTIKKDLVWESVVRENASERRGTHATKNRALVSGGGKKPYKQKGTGRAQAGSSRSPLWRKGGTVFGPQPRSYTYSLPKKVEKGALRAALQSRLKDGVVTIVDEITVGEVKTKGAVDLLRRLGATGKTLVIDVQLDENFVLSARNIPGVRMVRSGRLTARDVMNTGRIVATRAAVERLQEVLG